MGLKACLWNEDIDMTGGSAAVAAALAGGVRGGFVLDGTDSILAPRSEGMNIVAILSGTETASIEGGTVTIAGSPLSPISIGGTNTVPLQIFQTWGLKVPVGSRADLDFLGYDHGAAAQEVCSVIIDDPNIGDPWEFTPGASPDAIFDVQLNSAARVANTQSGGTDICGRTTAYTDGQTAIPNRAGIDIYVYKIAVRDLAGYSGAGLRSPAAGVEHEVCNLDFPTVATVTTVYDFVELFGGPMHCTAEAPIELYGYGSGAGALPECVLTLGVSGL